MEKSKKTNYHTVKKVPKSNRKILERGNIDTPSKQIYDRSLPLLSTGNSIKINWRDVASCMGINTPLLEKTKVIELSNCQMCHHN